MKSNGGIEIQRFQAAMSRDRLRFSKERWLPAAAFVALTLPLAFVGQTPTQSVTTNSVPTANPAPQSAPASTPAPLPQLASKVAAKPAVKPQPATKAEAATKPEVVAKHTAVTHKGTRRILISIPDRKLALVEDGKVQKIYRVAVGADVSPSPTGEFHIAQKITAPSYSHDGKVIAAGAGNPLGSRWMGLDIEHYGIHGTNMPKSIGRAASHGCIRMGKHDVEELFELASVGDVVEIHDERTEEIAQIFGAGTGTGSATGSGKQAQQPTPAVEVAQATQPADGDGQ
jgi:lipoprotein-anchoring transpeptidase ErfK/SrfK